MAPAATLTRLAFVADGALPAREEMAEFLKLIQDEPMGGKPLSNSAGTRRWTGGSFSSI
jgi:hypothetical protein